MGTTIASAPAKAILVGEHAVVYGYPAIAVPVSGRRATAWVSDAQPGSGVWIDAIDLDARYPAQGDCVEEHGHFLQAVVRTLLDGLGLEASGLNLEIRVTSDIPIARGMGSGAAVSAAVMRALAKHLGVSLDTERLSALVYETERLLHGTPSGIDNTTVTHEVPVWFVRAASPEPLTLRCGITLVLGDTGVPAHTRESVAMVRGRFERDRPAVVARLESIGAITVAAREALESGELVTLGALMDSNQAELAALGVSSPKLDDLVGAARAAGALGAKLSGGGMGGCMLALVTDDTCDAVQTGLMAAGAAQTIVTSVGPRP